MIYTPIQRWDKRAKKKSPEGYVIVNIHHHPKSFDGWYYEHRLVIERKLGRLLEDWETVHHINENKIDNSENNLFVCTSEQHSKAHRY